MSAYVELFGPLTPAAHAALLKLFKDCGDPLAGVPGPWNSSASSTSDSRTEGSE